jgi:predicted secreted hydrolase
VIRFAALVVLLAVVPQRSSAQTDWRPAQPDYAWSFPRDHWAHPAYKTEWWYFTGIVADTADATRRFGYQFTFFRVGLTPDSLPYRSEWATPALIMGHASMSDLATRTHVFSEVLYRPNGHLGQFGTPGDSLIAWSSAPYGTDDRWTLTWNGDGFDFQMRDDAKAIAMALSTRPAKPVVLQGPNGYSRKGAGRTAASLYYSFTRLSTAGTVSIGSDTVPVTGESWMDKEFGSNQLAADQVGWDWFSLRLDDGREVMLYLLRSEHGGTFARGTTVERDGRTRYIDAADWTLTALDTWRSDETGAAYPSRWRLLLPALELDVEILPFFNDQENVTQLVPDLFYWEGAVLVRDADGDRVGEGYVELTGYGTRTRPAI